MRVITVLLTFLTIYTKLVRVLVIKKNYFASKACYCSRGPFQLVDGLAIDTGDCDTVHGEGKQHRVQTLTLQMSINLKNTISRDMNVYIAHEVDENVS